MTRVAVVGSTGFVGRQVAAAISRRGAMVVPITAPRLTTQARTVSDVLDQLVGDEIDSVVLGLREQLVGADVVINAAGVSDATGGGDVVFGANALLPGVVASASPAKARIVHVSSAAVQGRCPTLDESETYAPFSDYSAAKALGEQVCRAVRPSAVMFRPTSVHGSDRRVTMTLARIASSPLSSVAGAGARPTPQVLVENVADAVAYVALTEETPPPVVLQPWEGMTTRALLVALGGKDPLRVPMKVSRVAIALLFALGRESTKVAGIARRLEMLWLGQEQEVGWLSSRWSPPLGTDRWGNMA